MENAAEIINKPENRIPATFATASGPGRQPEFECEICSDTGNVSVKVPYRHGKTVWETKKCECLRLKIRRRRLAQMPVEFASVSLETLTARGDIHPGQPEYVELLKKYPAAKFVIAGDFGTGKTHFFWALYAEAVRRDRRVWAGTARSLIAEFQKAVELSQSGERYDPPIRAEELRQNHTPYSIFLDDIDKARATEYAAEQLFEIIDACYAYSHQLVVTTNLRIDDLLEHFAGAGRNGKAEGSGRYGGAIVRRLLDKAHLIEMF